MGPAQKPRRNQRRQPCQNLAKPTHQLWRGIRLGWKQERNMHVYFNNMPRRTLQDFPPSAPPLCRAHNRSVGYSTALFAIRIFHDNLVTAKCEDITTRDLNPPSVAVGSGKDPFRQPTVTRYEMAGDRPLRIRNRFPGTHVATPNRFAPGIPCAACIRSSRGFKNAVIGHKRHQPIDVVPVPCRTKRLKTLNRHHRTTLHRFVGRFVFTVSQLDHRVACRIHHADPSHAIGGFKQRLGQDGYLCSSGISNNTTAQA